MARAQKLPPHNLMAEKALLGGLLVDGEKIVDAIEVLRGDEFYMPAHRSLFTAMVALFEKSQPIDMVTVTDALNADGGLKKIGGSSYLVKLTREVGDATNVAHYARIVAKKAQRRRLISAAVEMEAKAYDPMADEDELLDGAQASLFEVVERSIKPSYLPAKEVMKESLREVMAAYETKSTVTGVSTGFGRLNELTGGLQRSDLIVIAGRPSMGKTAFALDLARNAALPKNGGAPTAVAFFSLEMSRGQLGKRLMAAEAAVDGRRLRTGFLSREDWPRLTRAADRLAQAPLYIDDQAALTQMEVRAKARMLRAEHGLGLVIVDYLQLMRHAGRAERREMEISEISRSLKALAKELDIPVVALSQLNRRVEERPNKRPILSDLRESGALEQDADVIVFVHRPWLYTRNEDAPDEEKAKVELIIGKQRNGPTGTIEMVFVDKYMRFSERVEA